MPFGAYIFFIIFNVATIFAINHFQNRLMNARIRRMKQEIQELEDWVVAIVEEIEEATQTNKVTPVTEPSRLTEPTEATSPHPETASHPSESRRFVPELKNIDPKHRQILELLQQGMEIPQIARELGIGQGEIRLIVGLYKRS